MADTSGQQRGRMVMGRQIVLPFSKAFEIAWKGIKIRIWRSLITMSGIVLAIAFLMSVWTEGVFQRAFRMVPEDHDLYTVVRSALAAEAIASGAVRIRCAVMEDSGGVPAFVNTPGRAIRTFLDAEKAFQARRLRPEDLVDALQAEDDEHIDALVLVGLPEVLAQDAAARAVKDFVEMGGFLLIYGTAGVADAGASATDLLPADLLPPVSPPADAEEEAPGAKGSGVVMMPKTIQVPWQNHPDATFARTSGKSGAVPLAEAGDDVAAWRLRRGESGGSVVWYPVDEESSSNTEVVLWFVRGETTEGGEVRGSVADSLMGRSMARWARKAGASRDMRGIWLVTLSLMVCVVGITNAMLMSVTERFREIGTMKCLGALDQFVVKLFLIESSLQGVVGSLAGALIGFLLAFLRAMFTFHVKDIQTGDGYWLVFEFFPALSLLGWVSIALGTGIVLSVVAAIYPAIRAARMQPVQAMRSEA